MFGQVEALREVGERLATVLEDGFSIDDGEQARALVRAAEVAQRRLAAVHARLLAEVEASGAYRDDGHASAKAMVRHVAALSPAEAAARERAARAAAGLPELAGALAGGDLGADQFALLARVHANPRVRAGMAPAQPWLLRVAGRLSFRDFEAEVRQWERLVDQDGPEPANSRAHDTREARFRQDPFSLHWELEGGFGALQGAAMAEIHERYVDAERLADWEKARADHGDEVTAADLVRTEAQRRADALWQVFQDAAGADGSAVGTEFTHLVVWDAATFEEMTGRLGGAEPAPLDPATARCETLDGVPLEPVEAAANALVHAMRRVVVDAAGVVIDLGRARRFTGGARLAAQLNARHCPWPGCAVPVSRCEIDHTHEHAKGGSTVPANGGPFCGRHNRWKQKGFTVWRDPTGEWHVYRRDGTEIE